MQKFGEIYTKFYRDSNCKLAQSDIPEITSAILGLVEGEELCLSAIVSLITGKKFEHSFSRLFIDHILNTDEVTVLENQIWFHLKIASRDHAAAPASQFFAISTIEDY